MSAFRHFYMRSILLVIPFLVCASGFTQNEAKDALIGTWSVLSVRIVHPTICVSGLEPKPTPNPIFTFYKLADVLCYEYNSSGQHIRKGTWKIINQKELIIQLKGIEHLFKFRFSNSQLIIRNTMAELVLIKTN